jgi:acyl carrier protein
MSRDQIIEETKQFIVREFLNGKGEGLDADTPLIEWGVIDSIAIVALRDFVSTRFGVQIPYPELKPANMTSLTAIASMVERLKAKPLAKE